MIEWFTQEYSTAFMFQLAGALIASFVGTMMLWGLAGVIWRRINAEYDYFGDRITGAWTRYTVEGERCLQHSFSYGRCYSCGQHKLGLLQFGLHQPAFGGRLNPGNLRKIPDDTKDWLCGACGSLYRVHTYEVTAKVLRGPTDPIPELRQPATHAEVVMSYQFALDGSDFKNRINICKTCYGTQSVMVPQGNHSADMVKATCPDCYVSSDDSAPPAMTSRRRAVEHTRAILAKEA